MLTGHAGHLHIPQSSSHPAFSAALSYNTDSTWHRPSPDCSEILCCGASGRCSSGLCHAQLRSVKAQTLHTMGTGQENSLFLPLGQTFGDINYSVAPSVHSGAILVLLVLYILSFFGSPCLVLLPCTARTNFFLRLRLTQSPRGHIQDSANLKQVGL